MNTRNNKIRYRICINETEVIATFPSDIDAFIFTVGILCLRGHHFIPLSLENLKNGNMIINVKKSD